MENLTDIEIIAELWRRRVEWLWKMSEVTAYRDLDLEWLDEQIDKDEEAERANAARKAP
jgi:hypothetical protein